MRAWREQKNALQIALLALCFILTGASNVILGKDSSRQGKASQQSPFVEGVATTKYLWLRDASGSVKQFNRLSGEIHELAATGVVDLSKFEGRLVGLRKRGEEKNSYQLVDLVDGVIIGPKLTTVESQLRIIKSDVPKIIGQSTLYVLKNDKWESVAFDTPVHLRREVSVATSSDGAIYLGYNAGEWGGGLWAINPTSGIVTEIRRIDGDDCDGPLGKECDPITSVKRDPNQPNCVLASISLLHMSSGVGRVVRACTGNEVEVLYDKRLSLSINQIDILTYDSVQFSDLAITKHGWIGLGTGSYLYSNNGVIKQHAFRQFERWRGLDILSLTPEVVVIRTKLPSEDSSSLDAFLLINAMD